MNIVELKEKKIRELNLLAKEFKIDGAAGMRKQDLIFALLQAEIEKTGFDIRRRHTRNTSGWFRVLAGAQL